ncbi:glycerophosphodiester phosphodiesterase family protein [Gemmata sp. JC717]|uniref:glycerophosphodiester phosphodiesterase n=1 Tax=Gemmata algarum TaxID=2975278 RepID=UPI0021BB25B9|nr:glycerophosphodiester phosphodiesterase family protein [Gemmata algarum]MDY3554504.1 glycerophosphodiester phosphodiesterase family protein [Gemmata algarum]
MCGAPLLLLCSSLAAAPPAWDVRDHVPLKEFVIQSHRGAGELEAENTLEAFELGWKLGTAPEADVRSTKDGVIVALHDPGFDRVAKGSALAGKKVKDVPWADVKGLDVGAWKGAAFTGRRVPRLADVFAAMTGKPDRRLYLDIKDVDLNALAAEVKAARVGAQVVLASPKHAVIRQWKALVPGSGTLNWMGGTEQELGNKLAALRKDTFEGVTQLQLHVRRKDGALTPSKAFLAATGKELRERGILFQVLPWGADDEATYRELLGVASFATDYPEVTLKAVRAHYEGKTGRGKDAAPAAGAFKVTPKRDNDRVTVTTENGATVIDVRSPFGISGATIERVGNEWPDRVTLRLHLTGLESFTATCGTATVHGSASGDKRSLKLTVDGKEVPQGPNDPAFLDFKMVGKDGTPAKELPLKDGYFEMRLPKAFFDGDPKSFQIAWTDWYRR